MGITGQPRTRLVRHIRFTFWAGSTPCLLFFLQRFTQLCLIHETQLWESQRARSTCCDRRELSCWVYISRILKRICHHANEIYEVEVLASCPRVTMQTCIPSVRLYHRFVLSRFCICWICLWAFVWQLHSSTELRHRPNHENEEWYVLLWSSPYLFCGSPEIAQC